jgi:hypothetical protein
MLAGHDILLGDDLEGGFPATGGHLGAAIVHVVLEMQVTTYPALIEKASGGSELGGFVISVSDEQANTAKIQTTTNSKTP